MCLINFQFHAHPNYKLIVVANRDEFYDRKTEPAQFWQDAPNLLAGRDLVGLGTWLGITKEGKFAALTNYRNPSEVSIGKISRGEIVQNFLVGSFSSEEYLQFLDRDKEKYNGFNLILGNPEKLHYYNNIEGEIREIDPGTHGLSNKFLNTSWPKVVKGREGLKTYSSSKKELDLEELFAIMTDAEVAIDEDLPNTGVGMELERNLSPLFIKMSNYGTRCSTVILVDHTDRVTFTERTYVNGEFASDKRFTFQLV
ncbi:NRDE family protein [Psychrobacillus soli]|uniref:NRDE family protein n=1 Tax=Psychrobacillus soli TaxID=1543965 RepID=A0A544TGD9_9BACI|nr:NRDE family protein [Psychrobacillus soli]TQR16512.1 NRDE family protein [Psychrobacillus soli]